MEQSRRDFIKKTAVGTVGFTIGGLGFSAKSYANIVGSNNKINLGVVGINSRGKELIAAANACKAISISYICDVDSRVIEAVGNSTQQLTGKKPKSFVDFRELLEEKDLDAIAIATPEQWHAPMAIMGVKAGKHVYVEKPCCHNPREGELLVLAQKKYGKVIQMGNQQRSSPESSQAIKDIHEGLIGEPYFGKAWYSNKRGSIGTGKKVPVPEWLNWELWQGPAPRRDFQDIWVHYNWHWFRNWGTGEINNNGIHEIDICRWALGVDYPVKVTSAGGRYHYDDDWEFYDTQVVNFEYKHNKMITWEGKSCNPFEYYNRPRGTTIYGTKGTVIIDRNSFQAYNLEGKLIKEMKGAEENASIDVKGEGINNMHHMSNFLNAIREGTKLNSPINEGVISNTICHLGNISQAVGRTLYLDASNGHILGDGQAMQMWSREYERGWEPEL